MSVKSSKAFDHNELSKLDELLRATEKVQKKARLRAFELNNFLSHADAMNSANLCGSVVDLAAKQDDLRIFAELLKSYLERPKSHLLSLNINFLEKVRSLFAHINPEFVILALDLLETVVCTFGDHIRHSLTSKSFSLGVDVVGEQRFEQCLRCRNILLEVRLNAPFLVDRLDEAHRPTFNTIISQIDKIVEETGEKFISTDAVFADFQQDGNTIRSTCLLDSLALSDSESQAMSVKSSKAFDHNELSKLDELLRATEKVQKKARLRAFELNNFLSHADAMNSENLCGSVVDLAAKQDDLRIFAELLKSYLERPKSHLLSLNINFLEKVRSLFAHINPEFVILALDLLETVVCTFGDHIRHSLTSKSFSLGVDVVGEQRFEQCLRCRNILLEVRLNAPFLVDRLDEAHRPTFNTIISQIDKIVEETGE